MKLHNVRFILAIIVLFLAMGMALGLFSFQIPAENKDLINFILGAVSTWCGTVLSHYFRDQDKENRA